MGEHSGSVPGRLTSLISPFEIPTATESLRGLQPSDTRDLSLNANAATGEAYRPISGKAEGFQSWSDGADPISFWQTVAIIPVFGHQQVTESTVRQCFREPVDVVVVDNKGDYLPIARETVLQPGRNLGWLGGTIYGWAYALCRDWDHFLLLNNDVQLCRDFFRGLLSARQETGAGIVAPCYDGSFTFQHPSGGIVRAADYTPVPRHRRIGYCDGTAMLVTRDLVSKAGMFDPTFSPKYGWGASGEYCVRAKEHGFPVVLTEAAYCEHAGHLTAEHLIGESYVAAATQEREKAMSQRGGAEAWHGKLSACSLDGPVARPCDVSVITATKQRPAQLEQCCRQLKQQQLAGLSIEHIVVSDGPDESARAIAAQYRARFVVSIKPERFARGEASARDVGLRYANGDYVVFWDDDNEYTDNCVRTLFEIARGYDIGIGQTIHYGADGRPRVIPEDSRSAFHFGQIDTMCICVRRQVALRVRWADCMGRLASDFIWLNGLRRTGVTFRFRPAPIGVHWSYCLRFRKETHKTLELSDLSVSVEPGRFWREKRRNKMQLSIVIAAYNEGEALAKTITSCIETTCGLAGGYEILVVDDGSDDGSIDAVAQRFPEVTIYRHDVRQGAPRAKVTGVRHAQGDVLVFFDGHTKPDYGAIERLVADVQHLKGSAIVTPAVPALDVSSWKSDTERVGNGYGLDLETFDCGWLPLNELTPIIEFGYQFFESPALIGCEFAVSRDLYEELLGFDSGMKSWGMEDLDFGLHCWLMGSRILHDPNASIARRFQPNFETYSVPVEHAIFNQLRTARKIFSPSVWSDWVERCRQRVTERLSNYDESLWARAWRLFTDDLPSVEQQRFYLQGRLERDAFWFAAKFGLPWPHLAKGLAVDKRLLGNQRVSEQDRADSTGTTAGDLPINGNGPALSSSVREAQRADVKVLQRASPHRNLTTTRLATALADDDRYPAGRDREPRDPTSAERLLHGTNGSSASPRPRLTGRGAGGFLVRTTANSAENLEMILPSPRGGVESYWRKYDTSDDSWSEPVVLGAAWGAAQSATLVQTNIGCHQDLELVMRCGSKLAQYSRAPSPHLRWEGPAWLGDGAVGNPSIIQSREGRNGNLELVVPLASGGIAHYWRDNDGAARHWMGPQVFALELGRVDAVALIESTLLGEGRLEVIARIGRDLARYWRSLQDPGPWKGPDFFFTGAIGIPGFIQGRDDTSASFEALTPVECGGMAQLSRDNREPAGTWRVTTYIDRGGPAVDAVSLIQGRGTSQLEADLEAVAVSGPDVRWYTRERGPFSKWSCRLL